ncbi:hypothetical protein JAAARDRAFT_39443 [Jaapia argillacea MUCL 33604]|uniref:Uncharacterized protein n=1 Tax=Jaapia argillacea MUCL 33604 TaxID=933084 RepID=A0A067PF18_9AGAM|nr:hypothetical protein JAAARDRAFT_39443 [Jaapia argillacea MUCL 33604]
MLQRKIDGQDRHVHLKHPNNSRDGFSDLTVRDGCENSQEVISKYVSPQTIIHQR